MHMHGTMNALRHSCAYFDLYVYEVVHVLTCALQINVHICNNVCRYPSLSFCFIEFHRFSTLIQINN